jgi:polysaccharide biosynthesis protein PslJ
VQLRLRETRWWEELLAGSGRRSTWAVLAVCCVVGIVAGSLIGALGPVLAVAGAVVVVAAIQVLRAPQWGLYATVAVILLLPFAALPLNLGFSPTFLDVALLAVFMVWILIIAERRQTELVGTPVAVPLLAFALVSIAAFIAGLAHAHLSANVLRHFAEVLLALALFFVVVNTVRSAQQINRLLRVILLGGAAAAAIGIVLYYIPQQWTIRLLSALGRFNYPTGADVIQYIEDDPTQPMRAISTSVNPNVLGGMLILVTLPAIAQLFTRRPILPRWLLAGMVVVDSLCLYLTYSRGSLLGLALGAAVIGLLRQRKVLLVMIVAALLLLLLPTTQTYVAHLVQGLAGQDLATQMRFGEYKDAFTLIGRYPWLGVGFSGTPDIDLYIGVSNVYLLTAEQTGLVGLSLFLITLVVALGVCWRGWRRMPRTHPMEPALLGMGAAIIGLLAGGVFDHYFVNSDFPHSVSLFWLFIGLAVSAARVTHEEAPAAAGEAAR